MENLAKLQDYVCEYLENELTKFYSFKVWKDVLVMLRQAPKNASAFEIFDRYGDALKVRMMTADVSATNEDWVPTLSIDYEWKMKDVSLGLRAIIIRDKVHYVQLLNMMELDEKFGDEFDYVKEFEKTVVLMKALRG